MSDYSVLVGVSSPGCMVDSSIAIIDGSFVCGDETIKPGIALKLAGMSDGYNLVGVGGSGFVGVSLKPLDSCSYEEGEPISVVRRGRVWCVAEPDVEPEYKDPVWVNGDGICSASGELADGWFYTGDKIKIDSDLYIVGVDIPA